jgi:hypothetical protein
MKGLGTGPLRAEVTQPVGVWPGRSTWAQRRQSTPPTTAWGIGRAQPARAWRRSVRTSSAERQGNSLRQENLFRTLLRLDTQTFLAAASPKFVDLLPKRMLRVPS